MEWTKAAGLASQFLTAEQCKLTYPSGSKVAVLDQPSPQVKVLLLERLRYDCEVYFQNRKSFEARFVSCNRLGFSKLCLFL